MIKTILAVLFLSAGVASAQSFEAGLDAAAQAALAPVAKDPYLYKMGVRYELKAPGCVPSHSQVDAIFDKVKTISGARLALIQLRKPAADGSCTMLALIRVLPDDFPVLRAAFPAAGVITAPEFAGMVENAIQNERLAAYGENHIGASNYSRAYYFITEPAALPGIVGAHWHCAKPDWYSDMDGDHDYTRTFDFQLNADKSVLPAHVPVYNEGPRHRLYVISGKTIYFFGIGVNDIFDDVGFDSQEFTSSSAAELQGPFKLRCRP